LRFFFFESRINIERLQLVLYLVFSSFPPKDPDCFPYLFLICLLTVSPQTHSFCQNGTSRTIFSFQPFSPAPPHNASACFPSGIPCVFLEVPLVARPFSHTKRLRPTKFLGPLPAPKLLRRVRDTVPFCPNLNGVFFFQCFGQRRTGYYRFFR